MLPVFSLLIVVVFSIIIIRVASVALELTGLSADIAGFQALSAFTGAGFTTKESETIINNPTRRKIVQALILIGNIGFTTSLTSLLLAFMDKDTESAFMNLGLILFGAFFLWMVVKSRLIYALMKRIIRTLLKQLSFNMQIHDYHEILGFGRGFVISKIFVDDDAWLEGKALKDLKLDREGTLILNIEKRDGKKSIFMGAPNGKTVIEVNDVLTCYGRPEAIKDLAERNKGYEGDKKHATECEKLKEVELQEVDSDKELTV